MSTWWRDTPRAKAASPELHPVPDGILRDAIAAGEGGDQGLDEPTGFDHAGRALAIRAVEQQHASSLGSPALGEIFRLLLEQGENQRLEGVDARIGRAAFHPMAG